MTVEKLIKAEIPKRVEHLRVIIMELSRIADHLVCNSVIGIFDANGKNLPCTVIEAGPGVVTQVRTLEKDGYEAVQLAYDEKKEKNTSNALKGHFATAGTTPKRKLAEFKGFEEPKLWTKWELSFLLKEILWM